MSNDLDVIEADYARWLETLGAEDKEFEADNCASYLPELIAEVRELRTQRDGLLALVGKLTPPCCTHTPGPSPDAAVDRPETAADSPDRLGAGTAEGGASTEVSGGAGR